MVFNFLSLELMVTVAIIMVYTRFRKNNIFSLKLIEGLMVYLPPSKNDFEDL